MEALRCCCYSNLLLCCFVSRILLLLLLLRLLLLLLLLLPPRSPLLFTPSFPFKVAASHAIKFSLDIMRAAKTVEDLKRRRRTSEQHSFLGLFFYQCLPCCMFFFFLVLLPHRSAAVPSPASVETCSPLWQHRLIPPLHAAVPSPHAPVCADSRDDNREGKMSRGTQAVEHCGGGSAPLSK